MAKGCLLVHQGSLVSVKLQRPRMAGKRRLLPIEAPRNRSPLPHLGQGQGQDGH